MVLASFACFAALLCPQKVEDHLPRRGTLGASFASPTSEQISQIKLTPGGGAVIQQIIDSTATLGRAGAKPGDILIAIDGQPVRMQDVGQVVRSKSSGKDLVLELIRGGQRLELVAKLTEKPRDPGNSNFDVVYRHVESKGVRYRTILTTPKKPGKHPGFMFIQGLAPASYDFKLEGSTGEVSQIDGPLLYHVANSNFITIRVEKPGVGDSEGGPYTAMDYETELDIYRQTFKQLKEFPSVDGSNIFLFGHSMGGAFGPMIAAESPVKGIAVYGTASRTWFEYLLDIFRYQSTVVQSPYDQIDEQVRAGAHMMALAVLEGRPLDEIKKSNPKLAPLVDAYFPGGLFNGKNVEFWKQLNAINFAAYWSKLDAHVLAVRGASDFVTYDADHKLIADIVNRKHPGWGKFYTLPDSDHLFHRFVTERESQQNFGKGKFNNEFGMRLVQWMKEVAASI